MNPLEIALRRELIHHDYEWLLEPDHSETSQLEHDLIVLVANTTVEVCYLLAHKAERINKCLAALSALNVTVNNMLSAPQPKHLHVSSYDPIADRLIIESIAYSGDLFRSLRLFEIGSTFRIVQRDFDGAIYLERVQTLPEPTND